MNQCVFVITPTRVVLAARRTYLPAEEVTVERSGPTGALAALRKGHGRV